MTCRLVGIDRRKAEQREHRADRADAGRGRKLDAAAAAFLGRIVVEALIRHIADDLFDVGVDKFVADLKAAVGGSCVAGLVIELDEHPVALLCLFRKHDVVIGDGGSGFDLSFIRAVLNALVVFKAPAREVHGLACRDIS